MRRADACVTKGNLKKAIQVIASATSRPVSIDLQLSQGPFMLPHH